MSKSTLKTGFSVNDWKSSKTLRRLKWNSRCTLISGWGELFSKWDNLCPGQCSPEADCVLLILKLKKFPMACKNDHSQRTPKGFTFFILWPYLAICFCNHCSHSDYDSIMEQATSMSSVQRLPGTTTDPMGTTNKLEQAMDQLNTNMDRMSTFLGLLCQRIPTR